MRKRLIKKLHRKYLIDVVYGISLSSLWRKRLFDSSYSEKFLISYEKSRELPKYVGKFIKRYRLRYYVYK